MADDEEEPPVTVRRVEVAAPPPRSSSPPLTGGGASSRDGSSARTVRVLALTWNMHGRLPTAGDIAGIVPASAAACDIIAVGTQECERGIGASLLYASKAGWQALLTEAVGDGFTLLGSSTLGAIHLAVYVRNQLLDRISCAP